MLWVGFDRQLEGVPLVLDRLWFWTASFGQICPWNELWFECNPVPAQSDQLSVLCKVSKGNVRQVTGLDHTPPAPVTSPAVTVAAAYLIPICFSGGLK